MSDQDQQQGQSGFEAAVGHDTTEAGPLTDNTADDVFNPITGADDQGDPLAGVPEDSGNGAAVPDASQGAELASGQTPLDEAVLEKELTELQSTGQTPAELTAQQNAEIEDGTAGAVEDDEEDLDDDEDEDDIFDCDDPTAEKVNTGFDPSQNF